MNTLNKQPLGTIGAFRHDTGIAMGIYSEGNCVSLEYDGKTNKNVLLINDDFLGNIEVKHTDAEWNPKSDVERKLTNDFLATIIDNLEDWLDEKGTVIPNEDRDNEPENNPANIYGTDFDWMMDMLRDVCAKNGIIVEDEWEG